MKKSMFILFTACILLNCQTVSSQSSVFSNADNVALGGYDVVAYYSAYNAVRGNSDHSTSLEGTTYYFNSADHKKMFTENPSKYLPQYGGYCAFAMAMKGAPVPSDPATFKIRDGKLYLFFNDYYEGKPFNTIVPWNGGESDLIAKANGNWSKMKK